ncbi:hypothetical protein CS542_08585 [Pedobacter sp. IW39]|nr:hypothetical protein CS542_08585 [Pedobacter sp. IW39]
MWAMPMKSLVIEMTFPKALKTGYSLSLIIIDQISSITIWQGGYYRSGDLHTRATMINQYLQSTIRSQPGFRIA